MHRACTRVFSFFFEALMITNVEKQMNTEIITNNKIRRIFLSSLILLNIQYSHLALAHISFGLTNSYTRDSSRSMTHHSILTLNFHLSISLFI